MSLIASFISKLPLSSLALSDVFSNLHYSKFISQITNYNSCVTDQAAFFPYGSFKEIQLNYVRQNVFKMFTHTLDKGKSTETGNIDSIDKIDNNHKHKISENTYLFYVEKFR